MSPLTGSREAQLLDAVNTLMNARRTGEPLPDLPEPLRPADMDEVRWMQDTMAAAYGDVGGWKVGAPSADGTPLACPMPRAWMGPNGSVLSGMHYRYRGLEAEIAFLLGEDLPPRATPYTRDEVLGAIQSCHPAIEVLESAFTDPTAASHLAYLADLQMHGGFVFGPPCPDWQKIEWAAERVTLLVDGSVRVERTGSNTAGDLVRLLPWLANDGATRTGGLSAGQWITTGSWTGNTLGMSGSAADAHFATAGRVSLRFA